MHPIIIIFAILLTVRILVEAGLELINRSHVKKSSNGVPEYLEDAIDRETFEKSVEYTLSKNSFSVITTIFDGILLAVIVISGFLPWVFGELTHLLGTSVWGQGGVLFGFGLLMSIPGIPFEWYSQFKLEERFGFNKSTIRLWVVDKIKGVFEGLLLGFPIICLIIWLVITVNYWWLWAAIIVFAYQMVLQVVYPLWIMPWYNKFEPLPQGALRDRLMDLAGRTGFKAKTILVVDGSKRSRHSNAYFAGFGRFRRIVLYDTLINQLSEGELEAVLAHEIGHYKLGHIVKNLVVSTLFTIVGFCVLGFLVGTPGFIEGFGFVYNAEMPVMNVASAILLFGIMGELIMFWLTPLFNFWSRQKEFEADNFARESLSSSEPLIGALRKLHEQNLANLTPHPLYSGFNYSHPTLLEREVAMRNAERKEA